MKQLSLHSTFVDVESMNRFGGPAPGVAADDWPRFQGVPMQPIIVFDLETVPEIDVPAAEGKRLMVVFAESLFESPIGTTEGYAVRWVSQAEIDANPEPPTDFVMEKFPEDRDHTFEIEDVDWELTFDDAFIGGEPDFDGRKPEKLPEGAFVLQGPWFGQFTRANAILYVFEHGCYTMLQYDDEAEETVPNWSVALPKTKEFVVSDDAPASDALQKWGGIPKGISSYDWPSGMTHLFTFEWDEFDEWVEDGRAIAVFTKIKKNSDWYGQLGFFETHIIEGESLEFADEDPPNPKEVLPEKSLELVDLPEGTTWRDIAQKSFVGPRLSFVKPESQIADCYGREMKIQLNEKMLPNAPGPGVLYFKGDGGYPWWMPTGPATAGGEPEERYYPKGTLFNDSTTSAIVGGYRMRLDGDTELDALVGLDQAVNALNEKHGWGLTLFVPGDSTTNPDDSMYGDVVIGMPLLMTSTWDPAPNPFDPRTFAERMKKLPVLSDDDQKTLMQVEDVDITEIGDANVHLLSWGPLCYGAIQVGVPMDEGDRDAAIYTYYANQDMEQMWGPSGVDGKNLLSVEFSDITTFDYSENAIARHEKSVPDFESPQFFLSVRYD